MLFKDTTVGGTRSAHASVTRRVVIVERICRRVSTNKLIRFPTSDITERIILTTPNVQNGNGEWKGISLRRLGSREMKDEVYVIGIKTRFTFTAIHRDQMISYNGFNLEWKKHIIYRWKMNLFFSPSLHKSFLLEHKLDGKKIQGCVEEESFHLDSFICKCLQVNFKGRWTERERGKKKKSQSTWLKQSHQGERKKRLNEMNM